MSILARVMCSGTRAKLWQVLSPLRHCEPTDPRIARPDDRLHEAIQNLSAEGFWIASSQELFAMR